MELWKPENQSEIVSHKTIFWVAALTGYIAALVMCFFVLPLLDVSVLDGHAIVIGTLVGLKMLHTLVKEHYHV